MSDGLFALVLHCHLPFVRHPEHEHFIEENWFFEAVTETYIPLLEMFEGLRRDDVDFRATLAFSPPLCRMLTDELLQERCGRYIGERVELMERELQARRNTPYENAARMYRDRFSHQAERYGNRAGERVLDGFQALQQEGPLRIITSAATHALLPLLNTPEGTYAQVEQACRAHEGLFGARPEGIWLPECAYDKGVDEVLARCGPQYFFLESHGVLLADPTPQRGVFAPLITPSGVAAFGRDIQSSQQVWSTDEGYPGDYEYREFYRDLGFDADEDDIEPYLHSPEGRHFLGIKYHRITGEVPMGEKEPYRPGRAAQRAREHAEHFVSERVRQVRELSCHLREKPLIVSTYDAELFGHWWFEGPQFLNAVFREMHERKQTGAAGGPVVEPTTPAEYMKRKPVLQEAIPAASTWGYEGYYEVWVNGSTDWIYPRLQEAEEQMVELADRFVSAEGPRRRALNQCARELMLAQSSDWPFLISTDSAPEYATRRIRDHLERFRMLREALMGENIPIIRLAEMEKSDNIFPSIDFRLYAGGAGAQGGAKAERPASD